MRIVQRAAGTVFGLSITALIAFWTIKDIKPSGSAVFPILYVASIGSALTWLVTWLGRRKVSDGDAGGMGGAGGGLGGGQGGVDLKPAEKDGGVPSGKETRPDESLPGLPPDAKVGVYIGGTGRIGTVGVEENVSQGADYGAVIYGEDGVDDAQVRRNIHDPDGKLTPEQIDEIFKRWKEDEDKR